MDIETEEALKRIIEGAKRIVIKEPSYDTGIRDSDIKEVEGWLQEAD